jgi:serine protease Do
MLMDKGSRLSPWDRPSGLGDNLRASRATGQNKKLQILPSDGARAATQSKKGFTRTARSGDKRRAMDLLHGSLGRKSLFGLPVALLLMTAATLAAEGETPAPADAMRAATERATARVKPSLVRIAAVMVQYRDGREVKAEGSGSGFIISPEGYVVTNHHVAGNATRLVCVLPDNEEIEATLVGTDPLSDIAVLKLDTSHRKEFPAVEWGDSSAVAVGDTVLAMGSPLALSHAVTRGVVSSTKLTIPTMLRRRGPVLELDGEDVGALVRWIGHDAQIYPGNSGGPLVDLQGKVIGVNELSFGLGGAIPSDLAREVVRQIIECGRVSRAWLGIELQPLLKSSRTLRGALISSVLPDSPAERAGLRPNDVLLKIDGIEVNARFEEEIPLLNQQISAIAIGKEIETLIARDGKELILRLRAVEREPARPKQQELKAWGLTARNISFQVATEMKLKDRSGVLVTSVRPGGPSGESKPSLESGDVIRAVGDQPVRSLEELVLLTDKLTAGKTAPTPVIVQFDRKSEKFLTVVKLGPRDVNAPGAETRKAWLPIAVQVITRELAQQLGAATLTGVRVTQVYPGGSAQVAGVRVGDLIVALDGEPIAASVPGDEEVFTTLIRRRRIGDKAELQILRGNESLKLTVELERAPQLEREMRRFQDPQFEFSARDIGFFDRVREKLSDDITGALVTDVADGGWAALGDLRAGDIIQAVNGKTIADVRELEKTMKAVGDAKPKFAVLRVLRGVRTKFLELQPNWNQNPKEQAQ